MVLFGVITGTFGGVIGEIACNEVPNLFRPATPLYATCAFFSGWLLIGCKSLSLPAPVDFPVSAGAIVLVRLIALRYKIGLRAIE